MIKYFFRFNIVLLFKILIFELIYLGKNFNFYYIKSNNNKYFDHVPSPYYYLNSIYKDINKNELKKKYFIDIGCGTGRVLNFFFERGFKNIIGVEQSKKALKIFKKKNIFKQIKTFNQDILKYNFPQSSLIVYMYNPAPKKIIKKLITKLKKRKFKDLTILYLSPIYLELFDKKYFKIIKKAYDSKFRGYVILKKIK